MKIDQGPENSVLNLYTAAVALCFSPFLVDGFKLYVHITSHLIFEWTKITIGKYMARQSFIPSSEASLFMSSLHDEICAEACELQGV